MFLLISYILVALFIAWIWVDYYRLIDIYKPNKLQYFLIAFALGGVSVMLVFGIQIYFLNGIGWELTGEFVNDLMFCIFEIGLVEELAKLIPFLFFLTLFKSEVKEPIDYIAYAATVALGFSAIENVMYFSAHGSQIITGRAILASIGHMFFTALSVYGIILAKYKKRAVMIPLMILLAAAIHGLYDFLLMFQPLNGVGWIGAFILFFYCVSLFAAIINNCLNNSEYFNYKHVVNSSFVAKRLLTYYGIVLLVEVLLNSYNYGVLVAFKGVYGMLFSTILIIVVSCVRMSRFHLVKGRWFPLYVELPFYLGVWSVTVRGYDYNETHIHNFYHDYFRMATKKGKSSPFASGKIGYLVGKNVSRKNETYYKVKVFDSGRSGSHREMLIKPKRKGENLHEDKYPVVALMELKNTPLKNGKMKKKYRFVEWVVMMPV